MESYLLKYKYAKVFAPASVSNVGPGFDVLGFALEEPGDYIEVKVTDQPGVQIKKITGDGGKLSHDAERNTASFAALSFLNFIKADFGVEMTVNKRMPFASGLGSSAASAVGGVFAVNALLQNKLPNEELIMHALEGEKIASGNSLHADNVGPALYGGFVIARSIFPIDIIKIPFPEELACLIVYPHIEIKTEEARRILPEMVTRTNAVKQSAHAASLIAGIMLKDYRLMGRSMTDFIAEPLRAKLIPMYNDLKSFLLQYGAVSFNISGSGPTMFSFFDNHEVLKDTAPKLRKFLKQMSIETDVYITKVNNQGPKIIQVK
jgi:homoserine kinase